MPQPKKNSGPKLPCSTRKHRKTLMFNDKEMAVVQHFFKKYKIQNESKFFRETIIFTILRKTEKDHPTLF
ncbi:MAG: hypothetical protein LBL90_01585 [Prevotellaceae bacterium]|jgi:hypothetical protein|nr:hypothetical protein [Prevotellaceae bacterium]